MATYPWLTALAVLFSCGVTGEYAPEPPPFPKIGKGRGDRVKLQWGFTYESYQQPLRAHNERSTSLWEAHPTEEPWKGTYWWGITCVFCWKTQEVPTSVTKNTAVTPIRDGLGIWRFRRPLSLMHLLPLCALNRHKTAISKTAKTKLKTQKNRLKRRFFCQSWSECGDSNPGPPAPKRLNQIFYGDL